MKRLLFFILSFLNIAAFAQNDKKLTAKLQEAVKGYNGDIGIYVHNLKTGKTAALNSLNTDTIYPTASMIKVSILCGTMDKIEKGEFQYNQKLVYNDSLLYKGEDILGSFKNGDTIQLSKVALLMITMSDNTASLFLQKLMGTAYINNWLQQNGFNIMRDNSRAPERQEYRAKYGWGMSTPYEMCRLFTMIRNGKAVSEAASERMYRTLTRQYWDDKALSEIPPYVQAASKQGALDQSKSETVLINAPHGDYVFSIMTNNIKDQRWASDNETVVLIRKISALLWHYYEPQSKWKPAEGMGKFMKNE